jgi:hypothetical protein
MWELYCTSHTLGKACTLMKQGFSMLALEIPEF